jgi:DNA-binding SARP family transcriptional activator/tetratricopeptide (TPR) repeat protein
MEVRLLGSLELAADGLPVAVGGVRQRAVLALLVLHANQVVPAERLLVELWGEDAPPTAANALQAAVSRLRRALPQGRLITRTVGYVFRAAPDEIDVERFERLLASGREALAGGAAAEAAATLRRALSLWRGPALADFRFDPFAQAEIARLEELRLVCTEERIQADLALGAAAEVVGELQRLTVEHPLRERLRGQLMLALYRSDRQADALAVYRDLRELFADELGLEPAPALRELEAAILRQDRSLGAPAQPPVAAPAPVRKPVTVLCMELRVSAAPAAELDPEALDTVLGGALAVLGSTLERHGGKLAAVAGERVLGVFGVPTLHEDDALRAAQAALAARGALDAEAATLVGERGLRLTMRCGLATGEALVGGPESPGFAGDAIGRAVELAASAAAGEILVSNATLQLATGALEVEQAAPGRLRLRAAQAGARPMAVRLDAPLVGRDAERDRLAEAFLRAVRERAPVLATVLGEAGIGKTRLARELAAQVAGEATVVTGSCLPYGEGVTFWPLRELVRQAGAVEGTREELEALLAGEADAQRVAECLSGALSPSGQGASSAVEIFWAARRLLETLARREPLLVILDDLQWAEPTFLDLVEALAAQAEAAPLLLLCLARPELLEQRPAWAAGARRPVSVELQPLADDDATALLDALAGAPPPASSRRRLLEAADGNPFFLEQLVASFGEQRRGEGLPPLPPTIQALLAARLERLGPGERAVLTRAAILGTDFSPPAVAELLPEEARAHLGRHLRALVSKGLVRSPRPGPGADEGFRFRHILVQEAAYRAVPKSLRANLHERYVRWLERGGNRQASDHDEILGYHLEQAYRYRTELGRAGPQERELAAQAAERLATAARGALTRGDPPAGARLLERAVSLLPPAQPARTALLPTLAVALHESGRLEDADRILQEAIERSGAENDPRVEARARVEQQVVRIQAGSGSGIARARRVAEDALGTLGAHGDDLGLCRAWCLRASIEWTEGLIAGADEAWRRAAEHARRAGDERELFEILCWRASAAVFGPLPVTEAIRRCTEIREQVRTSPVAVAATLHPLGLLHAMNGDFDQARRLIRQGNGILDELDRLQSAVSHHEALVEMLAGQPAVAEERLRPGYARLEEMGERALLPTTAAMLAQAVHAQGRHQEADDFCLVAERTAAPEDFSTQAMWRGVRAKLLGREGRLDEAAALAHEAVRLAEPTDMLTIRAEALVDLAEVLGLRGSSAEADAAAREGLALYERKGDRVSAARVRLQLAARAPTTGRLRVNGGA